MTNSHDHNRLVADGGIQEQARQRVIDEYGLSPDTATSTEEKTPEWQEDFKGTDPENPNHILRDGDVLCQTIDADQLIPRELPASVREILLHPASEARSPNAYCDTCLSMFRDQHDFNLTADDLHCPDCGSQMKSCTHPERGTYKCKGCRWGY